MPEQKLMGYEEAASFIGVTLGTMYSMVARRMIPHHRIGRRLVRFSRDELQAWLQRHAVPDCRDGDQSEPGAAPQRGHQEASYVPQRDGSVELREQAKR
jgi:excisionase family DNA binding protein